MKDDDVIGMIGEIGIYNSLYVVVDGLSRCRDYTDGCTDAKCFKIDLEIVLQKLS